MSVNFNSISAPKQISCGVCRTKPVHSKNKTNKTAFDSACSKMDGKVLTQNINPPPLIGSDYLIAAGFIVKPNTEDMEKADTPVEITASDMRAQLYFNGALNIMNYLQSKVWAVMLLYKSGGKTSYSEGSTVEFSYDPIFGTDTMYEYEPDGTLIRESNFDERGLLAVKEYSKDGKISIITLKDGELAEYKEGYKKLCCSETMDKYYTFDSGEITMAFDGYWEFDDGSCGFSKSLSTSNGNMAAYYEDMESLSSGSSIIGLHLRYDKDGLMKEYVEDIVDGGKFGKRYVFKDGKWEDVPMTE